MEPSANEISRLSEEAAEHIVAMQRDRSGAAQRRFDTWVSQSPVHVEAYLRTKVAFWEFARAEAILEEKAKHGTRESSAAKDDEPVHIFWQGAALALKRRWLPAGLSTLLVGAVAVAFLIWGRGQRPLLPTPGSHQTETDFTRYEEARTFNLGAGSTMQLGYQSLALSRPFAGGQGREVTLLKGEALFGGHHDAAHLLRVMAGPMVMDAQGTEFDVAVRDSARVTVLQGTVTVQSRCPAGSVASKEGSVELAEGDRATLVGDCGARIRVKHLSSDETVPDVAWSGRSLLLEHLPVSTAIDILNRCNPNAPRVVIRDPALAQRALSGRFQFTDREGFIKALSDVLGTRLERGTDANGTPVSYLVQGP